MIPPREKHRPNCIIFFTRFYYKFVIWLKEICVALKKKLLEIIASNSQADNRPYKCLRWNKIGVVTRIFVIMREAKIAQACARLPITSGNY